MIIKKERIEEHMFQVKRYLIAKYGEKAAVKDMKPLIRYLNSGEASFAFVKILCSKKPYVIGRRLHYGGFEDLKNCIEKWR